MKIKFLSILSSLAILSLVATSCLKSDNNEYTLSTDTSVYAISIGKIYGKDFPLSIDLKKGYIFNNTPLPYGADTLINKTVFEDIRTATGFLTRKDKEGQDTIFTYPVDTIDLTRSFEFKVYAMAPEYTKTYTVDIKYYMQDPDTLIWAKHPLTMDLGSKPKALASLDNQLYIFTPEGKAYTYAQNNLQELSTTGLPTGITVKSLWSNSKSNSLYLLSSDKTIYQSTNQGEDWNATDWGVDIEEILAVTPENKLFAIQASEQGSIFSSIDLSLNEKSWKTAGKSVPTDFSTLNLSATFNSDKGVAFVMGTPQTKEPMTVWMSESGLNWVKMNPSDREQACPYFKQPQMFFYQGKLNAFDGFQDALYQSTDGIHWTLKEEKFLLPKDFQKKGAGIVVDESHHLWLLENSQPYIWAGILNIYNEITN